MNDKCGRRFRRVVAASPDERPRRRRLRPPRPFPRSCRGRNLRTRKMSRERVWGKRTGGRTRQESSARAEAMPLLPYRCAVARSSRTGTGRAGGWSRHLRPACPAARVKWAFATRHLRAGWPERRPDQWLRRARWNPYGTRRLAGSGRKCPRGAGFRPPGGSAHFTRTAEEARRPSIFPAPTVPA